MKRLILTLLMILLSAPCVNAAQITLEEVADSSLGGLFGDDFKLTTYQNWANQNLMFTELYSWGDHAEAGYLQSYTETDPAFTLWGYDFDDLINVPAYLLAANLTPYRTSADQDTIDSGKQATLVSGTNIKTINSTSILGSGDIEITGSVTIVQTTDGESTTSVPSEDAVGTALDGKQDAMGGDDNYVTDAEKTTIENLGTAATRDAGSDIGDVPLIVDDGDGNPSIPFAEVADGSGNSGNLSTTVDTLQELIDAVDALSVSGGSAGTVIAMPTYSDTGECDEASEAGTKAYDATHILDCRGTLGWYDHIADAAWVDEAPAAGCSETATYSVDAHSGAVDIGNDVGDYFAGFLNKATSGVTVEVCSLDVYLQEDGDLTGESITVELWDVNASTFALETLIDTYATVDATTAPTSFGYVTIVLDSTITIGANQALVLTMNSATGSTNYLRWAFSSTLTPQSNFILYSWNSDGTVGDQSGVNGFPRSAIYGDL